MGHSPYERHVGGEGPSGTLLRGFPAARFSGPATCSGKAWVLSADAPRLDSQELAIGADKCRTPEHFLEEVFQRSSPLEDTVLPLPAHVQKAVRLRAALGSRVSGWRESQLSSLRTVAASFLPSRSKMGCNGRVSTKGRIRGSDLGKRFQKGIHLGG